MKSSASEPDLSVVIYDCPLILVPGASILFVSVADREPWLGSRTCGRLHSRGKKRREKWRIQQQKCVLVARGLLLRISNCSSNLNAIKSFSNYCKECDS